MSTVKRQTIYAQYVEEQIITIAGEGGGVFTFKEFAEKVNLSPNHNLRAQLRYHESTGRLWIGYGYVGNHSTHYLYHINSTESNLMDYDDAPL